MTVESIIEKLQFNLDGMSSRRTSRLQFKLLVAAAKGLLILFERKLGILEPQLGEEELTNGDIFVQAHNDGTLLYAYAEMPSGNKKWFKKTKQDQNWSPLTYDPTLSIG